MFAAARLAVSLPVIMMFAVGADAHIDAVTGQDYSGFQRNDGGGSCCDWHDCRPASAPFMDPNGEVMTDRAQNKFRFEPNKVVPRPSDDGNWHICTIATRVLCIIAPAETRRDSAPFDRLLGSAWPAKAPPGNGDPERELASAPICHSREGE